MIALHQLTAELQAAEELGDLVAGPILFGVELKLTAEIRNMESEAKRYELRSSA